MPQIVKLDPKVVDQIAAGEVVERPASVLKELLDNALDAGSTKITVKIKDGGTKLIEVIDNGLGIDPNDLPLVFEAHATSKIKTIEDLNSVLTFGFRGEALSSISSVALVTLITRTNNSKEKTASKMVAEYGELSDVSPDSRDIGTTIRVENLFENIPARKKFLKTARTEYRKILDVFIPFALINPDIHFVLENNGKQVYNLPAMANNPGKSVLEQRVSSVVKGYEFIDVFYDGDGITVGGLVAHPSYHTKKTNNQYLFVNNRPVWDYGVSKSVSIGANRFIPDGTKLPYILSIKISPELVDVNVHPRKQEVRFINPYRLYSAVEKAVKAAFEKSLKADYSQDESYDRLRNSNNASQVTPVFKGFSNANGSNGEAGNKTIENSGVRYGVKKSLEFSKSLLEDNALHRSSKDFGGLGEASFKAGFDTSDDVANESFANEQMSVASDEDLAVAQPHALSHQYLNRYIVTSMHNDLWIIDQHAAAERVRFEKLLSEYQGKGIETQSLLLPIDLELGQSDESFITENIKTFAYLGFNVDVKDADNVDSNASDNTTSKDPKVSIMAIPALLADGDAKSIFMEILEQIKDIEDIDSKERVIEDEMRNSVIATMACHSSVRMNRKLNDSEASRIVSDLLQCENSYSCPHGRPIIWKLGQAEIDKHFER